jgi:hypothetical protein
MNQNILFNSVFFETHPENNDLRMDLNNLTDNYQTNEIIQEEREEEDELYQFDENHGENHEDIFGHLDDVDLLTNTHIEELKMIFYKKSLEEEVDECSLNQSQKNDYLSYLNNATCCTDSCQRNINHQNAFRRYEAFISLNKENQDSFLLGFMTGSQISQGQNSQHAYNFDGVRICRIAFLNIYKLGLRRWRNLKSHFSENDIELRTNDLKGRKSNHAFF